MTTDFHIETAIPVLMVSDYVRSRAFYVRYLGFAVVEEGGDPARFGILRKGSAVLFLNAGSGGRPPTPGVWDVYFHVQDIDAVAQTLMDAGLPLSRSVENTTYGMREFEIEDPDGAVLCFGEDTHP